MLPDQHSRLNEKGKQKEKELAKVHSSLASRLTTLKVGFFFFHQCFRSIDRLLGVVLAAILEVSVQVQGSHDRHNSHVRRFEGGEEGEMKK